MSLDLFPVASADGGVECSFLCGAAAHLLPGKFSEHRDSLLLCVIGYYVLCAISYLFSVGVMKEDFLVLCASDKHKTPRLRISLRLKRFASDFTLRISGKDR